MPYYFFAIRLWLEGSISWRSLVYVFRSHPMAVAGVGGSYLLEEFDVGPDIEDCVRASFERAYPVPYSITWNGSRYVSRLHEPLGEAEAETMNEWLQVYTSGWQARS